MCECSSSTPTLKMCHASVPSTSAQVCLRSHWSAPLTLLQVFGGPTRTRELSPDGISALWPYLHRLPRPAADEAAHGPVSEEVQVSPFLIQTCLLGSFTHIEVLRLCFESPFESPVAFLIKCSTIGLLSGFSHRPVNLVCISKIGGGSNLSSFHTDQSGTLAMPHI